MRVQFSARSSKSGKKSARVSDSARQISQKHGKAKQTTVVEKPPLGKVPKLKLDFVTKDKVESFRGKATQNLDSKKASEASMATIAAENAYIDIGATVFTPSDIDVDDQTARRKYSRR